MDRPEPGSDFLCPVAAVFLFTRARNVWARSGSLGCILLQLCAAEYFCRALVHARRAVAEPCDRRPVFFSTLAPGWASDTAVSGGGCDFALTSVQNYEHRCRCAAVVSGGSPGRRGCD